MFLSLPLNADDYLQIFGLHFKIKIGEVSDEISIKDSNFSIHRKLIPSGPLVLFLSNRKEITHGISQDGKIFVQNIFTKQKKNMMATLDFEEKNTI